LNHASVVALLEFIFADFRAGKNCCVNKLAREYHVRLKALALNNVLVEYLDKLDEKIEEVRANRFPRATSESSTTVASASSWSALKDPTAPSRGASAGSSNHSADGSQEISSNTPATASAILFEARGGTASPICARISVFLPWKRKLSGKVWSLALSLSVSVALSRS